MTIQLQAAVVPHGYGPRAIQIFESHPVQVISLFFLQPHCLFPALSPARSSWAGFLKMIYHRLSLPTSRVHRLPTHTAVKTPEHAAESGAGRKWSFMGCSDCLLSSRCIAEWHHSRSIHVERLVPALLWYVTCGSINCLSLWQRWEIPLKI